MKTLKRERGTNFETMFATQTRICIQNIERTHKHQEEKDKKKEK